MNNELINSADIKEKVVEQVKVSFMNLIPEDSFAELVEKELNAFFEEEKLLTITNGNSWDGSRSGLKTEMTPFRQIVWQELYRIAKEKFEEIKNGVFMEKVDQVWDEAKEEFIDVKINRIEKMAEEQALAMSANAFQMIIQMALEASSQQITLDMDEKIKEVLRMNNINVY